MKTRTLLRVRVFTLSGKFPFAQGQAQTDFVKCKLTDFSRLGIDIRGRGALKFKYKP